MEQTAKKEPADAAVRRASTAARVHWLPATESVNLDNVLHTNSIFQRVKRVDTHRN